MKLKLCIDLKTPSSYLPRCARNKPIKRINFNSSCLDSVFICFCLQVHLVILSQCQGSPMLVLYPNTFALYQRHAFMTKVHALKHCVTFLRLYDS